MWCWSAQPFSSEVTSHTRSFGSSWNRLRDSCSHGTFGQSISEQLFEPWVKVSGLLVTFVPIPSSGLVWLCNVWFSQWMTANQVFLSILRHLSGKPTWVHETMSLLSELEDQHHVTHPEQFLDFTSFGGRQRDCLSLQTWLSTRNQGTNRTGGRHSTSWDGPRNKNAFPIDNLKRCLIWQRSTASGHFCQQTIMYSHVSCPRLVRTFFNCLSCFLKSFAKFFASVLFALSDCVVALWQSWRWRKPATETDSSHFAVRRCNVSLGTTGRNGMRGRAVLADLHISRDRQHPSSFQGWCWFSFCAAVISVQFAHQFCSMFCPALCNENLNVSTK